MGTKTLFLALDSVEPRAMERWMSEGRLPVLARLREAGAACAVRNFRGFGNGVFWPSLATCSGPGHHGRYYISQLVPGTYRVRRFAMQSEFGGTPFWKHLEQAGQRVACVDMIRTPMAGLGRGLEVHNWLPHDGDGPLCTRPAKLAEDLTARFGPDPFDGSADVFFRQRRAGFAELARLAGTRIGWKTEWCEERLRSESWDFFAVGIQEAHDIGHLAWHVHDVGHRAHDAATLATEGDPVLAVYRHIDAAVGRLAEAAGPDATIIGVTGPGMEPNSSGNDVFREVVRRLATGQTGPTEGAPAQSRRPRLPLRQIYRSIAPSVLRGALRSLDWRLAQRAEARVLAGRPFFSVPHNHNAGAIRINLRGREPNGLVAPGEPFERTIAELEAALLAVRDTAHDRPAVAEIVRVRDCTSGPHASALPDLLVIWNREADFSEVWSPAVGTVRSGWKPLRTGDHSDRGQLIVSSPRPFEHPSLPGELDPAGAGEIVRRLASAGHVVAGAAA